MCKKDFNIFIVSAIVVALGILYIYIGKRMLGTDLPRVFDWFVIADGALTTALGIGISAVHLGDCAVCKGDKEGEDWE